MSFTIEVPLAVQSPFYLKLTESIANLLILNAEKKSKKMFPQTLTG